MSIKQLEGTYLDSEFRSVHIYVCSRKPEPHFFEIPVESNQRTKTEEKWLSELESDKCPFCNL